MLRIWNHEGAKATKVGAKPFVFFVVKQEKAWIPASAGMSGVEAKPGLVVLLATMSR